MIHQMNQIIKNLKQSQSQPQQGQTQIEQFWLNVSLLTEQVVDACRRSINKDGSLVEFQKGQI